MLLALAPFHGRLTLGGDKVAGFAPGPGAVLPAMVHGGPGRAGGGEELGGLRGLSFYLQTHGRPGLPTAAGEVFPRRRVAGGSQRQSRENTTPAGREGGEY